MGQQSRLEQEGISKRKETIIKNDFSSKTEPYSDSHELARTHDDQNHPLGKGTGEGGHTYTIPDGRKSKTAIDRSQFNTENGGGSFDKFGRNNSGGRNFLQKISLYGPDKQYGPDSIVCDENINDGQVVIDTNSRRR